MDILQQQTPPPISEEVPEMSQPTFVPVVDEVGSKKLKLQISLLENPVVIREGQPNIVVRGYIILLCREPQKDRGIRVQLTGIKSLFNDQQMGGSGSTKSVLVKKEKILNIHGDSSVAQDSDRWAVGTYKVPFEFVLENSLPPSLHVPHCTIEYSITATINRNSSSYQKFIPYKPIKDQMSFLMVRYINTGDPTDFLSRLRPVVRIGTLGSTKSGRGALPYRLSTAWNTVTPGEIINIKLDVYPPNQLHQFNNSELVALTHVVTNGSNRKGITNTTTATNSSSGDNSNMYSDGYGDSDVDQGNVENFEEENNEKNENINTNDQGEMTAANQTINTVENASNGTSLQDIPLDRPPTYVSNSDQRRGSNWAIAAKAMIGLETNVTSYKVRAKLIQSVCYLTDHDLVADTADDVYLFWTRRTITKEKISDSLDLTSVINGKPLSIDWDMVLPPELQCDMLTTDIQVKYDIFIDFFPRDHAGGSSNTIKGVVSRVNNRCITSKMPIRIIPVSVPTLLANPPSYGN